MRSHFPADKPLFFFMDCFDTKEGLTGTFYQVWTHPAQQLIMEKTDLYFVPL
ncbi:hypothetical protein HSIEG1_3776 [Enterococcus sp. HSIEG1]|nr:hypothetical protein HSIEG1_3776 [Enterococcus sp. HSIEG1]